MLQALPPLPLKMAPVSACHPALQATLTHRAAPLTAPAPPLIPLTAAQPKKAVKPARIHVAPVPHQAPAVLQGLPAKFGDNTFANHNG